MTTALLGRRLLPSAYRSVTIWSAIRHSYERKPPRSQFSNCTNNRNKWIRLNRYRALYLGTVTLTVAAPLGLSPSRSGKRRKEADDPEKTTEQLMLEESDLEREEYWAVSGDQLLIFRVLQNIQLFVVNWVIEPLATGFRFVTLVTIFVPVILAVPLCFLGPRIPEKSNERRGIIMWYAFLIKSMENAGPTFIKVILQYTERPHGPQKLTGVARTMGGVKDGYISNRDVRDDVKAALKRPTSFTPRYEKNNINRIRREVPR